MVAFHESTEVKNMSTEAFIGCRCIALKNTETIQTQPISFFPTFVKIKKENRLMENHKQTIPRPRRGDRFPPSGVGRFTMIAVIGGQFEMGG